MREGCVGWAWRAMRWSFVPLLTLTVLTKFYSLQHHTYSHTGPWFGRPMVLHVVTYSNTYFTHICEYLRSCILQELHPVVLGWNSTWKGLNDKLVGVVQILQSLPGRDVVLFTDSHDVIVCGNERELLERFVEFNAEVVFGSEKGCWPMKDQVNGTYLCHKVYPPSPTPYRYLNSGGVIGYADSMLKVLRIVEDGIKADPQGNDQELLSKGFLWGKLGDGVKLDYQQRIFQSLHMSTGREAEPSSSGDDIEFRHGLCKIRNKVTGENPLILHFNGGGKHRQRGFQKRLLPYNVDSKLLATCVGVGWDLEKEEVSGHLSLQHMCCNPEWTDSTFFFVNKFRAAWAQCSEWKFEKCGKVSRSI